MNTIKIWIDFNASVVPANAMDLGYANEACIANANCIGRKLASCEAGAVSNSGGPPAGAPEFIPDGISVLINILTRMQKIFLQYSF